jgi:hypothetical protein
VLLFGRILRERKKEREDRKTAKDSKLEKKN